MVFPRTQFIDVPLIDGLTLASVANGSAVLAPGAAGGGHVSGVLRAGGGFGGAGPLSGVAIVNVLSLFNLVIPLSVVGNTGASAAFQAGSLAITVLGTGWTTGTVAVTGLTTFTPNGLGVSSVGFTGTDARDPSHVGWVTLISPFKVITNVAGNLAGIARERFRFLQAPPPPPPPVPEPRTLLLLSVGLAGLGLHRLRRRRRR